jgi:hypothetical protein
MTPAQYAAKFLHMGVFVTAEGAAAAAANSGRVPMYLPDPKAPGMRPGKPMEPGRWQYFKVDRYRIHYSGYSGFLTGALHKEATIGLKVMRIDGAIDTLSVPLPDISYSIAAPFWGKGYPEDFQVVIQLWKRYGIAKTSVNSLITQGLIGLDCNGFVGGYIERRHSPGVWLRKGSTKTSYSIRSLLGPASEYFESWSDFQPPRRDVLVLGMCDAAGNVKDYSSTNPNATGHIVITEPGTMNKSKPNGPVTLKAVESTGPVGHIGLQITEYQILSMASDSNGKGIFYVQRGSKKGKPEEFVHFRITRLK